MKKLFYFISILIFGACSVTTEEEDESNYGTSDGLASAPMELTVGTAKTGGVAKYGSSYYKFTPSSTGAGSYELNIASLVISDSWSSSSSVYVYLYTDSGYSTMSGYGDSCLASCTVYFDYSAFDASTTYYLRIYGYGKVTYSLTVSQGGSEGSANDPVELTLGTAHSGSVEGTNYYGKSYYKFTTVAADNYTVTMNNSDSLDCQLYSDSGFITVVDSYYNECTAGTNISDNFTGSDASWNTPGSGLSANTAYYLKVEGESSTAKTTTYNITVQAASEL
jgi:hypothetical protein